MTMTTTIRWAADELNDIKAAAQQLGLPVALFLKSLALSKVRQAEHISPHAQKQILQAEEEIKRGDVDTFESTEDFLSDLTSHVN